MATLWAPGLTTRLRLRRKRSGALSSVQALLPDLVTIWHAIAEDQVRFLKARTIAAAESLQIRIRNRWFSIRRLSDGYFMAMPARGNDGCEKIMQFAHDGLDRCFAIDLRARAACWHRYGRREQPPWRTVAPKLGRRRARKV